MGSLGEASGLWVKPIRVGGASRRTRNPREAPRVQTSAVVDQLLGARELGGPQELEVTLIGVLAMEVGGQKPGGSRLEGSGGEKNLAAWMRSVQEEMS